MEKFWDIVVLGNIPGTSIQVSFENWLYAAGTLVCLSALVWCLSKRMLFAAWRIARIMHKEINAYAGA